ncbi:MAG: hypothetical protein WB988_25385 [Candidatus Nitrosopolaris sp.]
MRFSNELSSIRISTGFRIPFIRDYYCLDYHLAYGVLGVTFPTKGQKVPVGNIVVSGTSLANATDHCTVSLNINSIRPYQNVTPTGHNGPKDYSKWTFTITPKYSAI